MRFKDLGNVVRSCAPRSPNKLFLITQLPYANKRTALIVQGRKGRCIPWGHVGKRAKRSSVPKSTFWILDEALGLSKGQKIHLTKQSSRCGSAQLLTYHYGFCKMIWRSSCAYCMKFQSLPFARRRVHPLIGEERVGVLSLSLPTGWISTGKFQFHGLLCFCDLIAKWRGTVSL